MQAGMRRRPKKAILAPARDHQICFAVFSSGGTTALLSPRSLAKRKRAASLARCGAGHDMGRLGTRASASSPSGSKSPVAFAFDSHYVCIYSYATSGAAILYEAA